MGRQRKTVKKLHECQRLPFSSQLQTGFTHFPSQPISRGRGGCWVYCQRSGLHCTWREYEAAAWDRRVWTPFLYLYKDKYESCQDRRTVISGFTNLPLWMCRFKEWEHSVGSLTCTVVHNSKNNISFGHWLKFLIAINLTFYKKKLWLKDVNSITKILFN